MVSSARMRLRLANGIFHHYLYYPWEFLHLVYPSMSAAGHLHRRMRPIHTGPVHILRRD